MRLTSSKFGKAPSVIAVWIINGIPSVVFHSPTLLSPTSCPILKTLVGAPAFRFALRVICSDTHLDRAYPVPCAHAGVGTGPSGTLPGLGDPPDAETDEQKKNRAGLGVSTDWHNWMRLWTAFICWPSKLWTGMLKLTAQALWITIVSFDFRSARRAAPRPKSGRPKSQDSGTTLDCWRGLRDTPREVSEFAMRDAAAASSGARTAAQTDNTVGRAASWARR